jgi:glycosyltransferase involved in cell wall biosynthesis
MKTLCVYPHPPEGVNGVMTFIQNLYHPFMTADEIKEIGLWFDEYCKDGKEVLEARTPQDKERLKRNVAEKLSGEHDLTHLNTYALDIDYIRLLESLKRAKPEKRLIYTAHSLAPHDFQRNPYDLKLFGGIDDDFLMDVIKLSEMHLRDFDEESKERKARELLMGYSKHTDWESVNNLKIISYMIHLQQKIMKISDKNVFVSEFLRDWSKRMFGIDGVVIPNGTNMHRIYDMHKDKIDASAKMWRDGFHHESDILIGYVGRVIESKGVIELLEAFKILSKEMKNLYLYFSGPYSDHIFENIRKKSGHLFDKRIFFMDRENLPKPLSSEGEVKMAKYYKVFDLIACPSYNESFGLVPLEAVSCGVPVLVRSVDNLSYFVKEGICEGFEDEMGKRPAPGLEHLKLYQKMREMLSNIDSYRGKTESARGIVKEKYSTQLMRERYRELLMNPS